MNDTFEIVKKSGKKILIKFNGEGKSVIIPEDITEIGESAFEDKKNLETIVIPEGLTEIGDWAFGGCTSLTSVVIPEG